MKYLRPQNNGTTSSKFQILQTFLTFKSFDYKGTKINNDGDTLM